MNWIADLFYQIKRLFQWWTVIAPWEQAIRVRAGGSDIRIWKLRLIKGHVTDPPLGAGIHTVIPYLDKIYKQSIRTRVSDLPVQNLTTSDGHSLTISGLLFYEISDLLKLYQKLHHAEDTISGMAAGAIAEYVGTHTKEECTPAVVEHEANKLFSTRGFGIKGTRISLITFTYARTYRFITGDASNSTWGDSLSTTGEDTP